MKVRKDKEIPLVIKEVGFDFHWNITSIGEAKAVRCYDSKGQEN